MNTHTPPSDQKLTKPAHRFVTVKTMLLQPVVCSGIVAQQSAPYWCDHRGRLGLWRLLDIIVRRYTGRPDAFAVMLSSPGGRAACIPLRDSFSPSIPIIRYYGALPSPECHFIFVKALSWQGSSLHWNIFNCAALKLDSKWNDYFPVRKSNNAQLDLACLMKLQLIKAWVSSAGERWVISEFSSNTNTLFPSLLLPRKLCVPNI